LFGLESYRESARRQGSINRR